MKKKEYRLTIRYMNRANIKLCIHQRGNELMQEKKVSIRYS